VDEHGIALKLRQTCTNGIRAVHSTFDEGPYVNPGKRTLGELVLACSNNDPDLSNRRVADQRLHGPPDQRLSAKQAILLGQSAAEALAFAGRNDECRGGHEGRPLGMLALSAKGSSTI